MLTSLARLNNNVRVESRVGTQLQNWKKGKRNLKTRCWAVATFSEEWVTRSWVKPLPKSFSWNKQPSCYLLPRQQYKLSCLIGSTNSRWMYTSLLIVISCWMNHQSVDLPGNTCLTRLDSTRLDSIKPSSWEVPISRIWFIHHTPTPLPTSEGKRVFAAQRHK